MVIKVILLLVFFAVMLGIGFLFQKACDRCEWICVREDVRLVRG